MVQPSQVITDNYRQSERVKNYRYKKQLEYEENYQKLLIDTKEMIRKERGGIIEENLIKEIRNWIKNYYQQTGKIPDLPSAESGGSRIMFSRQV